MRAITSVLTIAIKEIRSLVHRPLQVVTLILGPLLILVVFGLGSSATAQPPAVLVVVPSGEDAALLRQEYQDEIDEFLNVVEYTQDEAGALARLEAEEVEGVIILPPDPEGTLAQGKQATVRVVYNEIDPVWRWVVPTFVHQLVGEVNRQLFIETAEAQQAELAAAAAELGRIIQAADLIVAAAEQNDRPGDRARAPGINLADAAALLGPEAIVLQALVGQLPLDLALPPVAAPGDSGAGEREQSAEGQAIDLAQSVERLRQLQAMLQTAAMTPPNVLIAPIAVQEENMATLLPNIITFSAPGVLALLVQHVAVSMGALAFVQERLGGIFDLYVVAPISNLQLLLGKYLAYSIFTLVVSGSVLAVLLFLLDVPLVGSPLQLALVLVTLTLASVGLGFVFSLLATTDRQAVQFAMLALLAVVFFSGFAMPLESLHGPALAVSHSLPATYGVQLFRDVMLRGTMGSDLAIAILAVIGSLLFVACLGLLHWRTRAQ